MPSENGWEPPRAGPGQLEWKEQWLPVVGLEAIYEVSDHGRVRSLDRIIEYVDGRSGNVCLSRRNGRVLRPYTAPTGYQHVNLNHNGSRTVHSLVAEAFIGPRPDDMETRHINGHASDCRVTNLVYGTRSENSEDSKRHGTHFHAGLTVCKRGHDLTDPANMQKVAAGDRRVCLACRRERQHLYNAGTQVTVDGYCINGHPKTPENRYSNGTGHTRCKPCANESNRKKGGDLDAAHSLRE